MPSDRWPGVGERIRESIKENGFVNRQGDADVSRFAMTNGWVPTYVYRWINNLVTPDRANLLKLGNVLKIAPAWILFGDDVEKEPKARRRGRKLE